MTENNAAEQPVTGQDADMMVVPLPVAKTAQGDLMDRAVNDLQITEWKEAGKKVVKYPVDLGVLLQSTVMGTYHRRCLAFKRTATIGNGYETARPQDVANVLPDDVLAKFCSDYDIFGNAYLELESNVMGRVMRLHHVRANTLWQAADGSWLQKVVEPEKDMPSWRAIPKNKIIHLKEYSPLSDHYGVPDWVPALLPIALAWESNDFKRKFYQNGAHAGLLILLTGMKGLTETQRKEVEEKIKSTKGPGNFATLFMAFKDPEVKVEVKGVASETPVRDDYPEIQKSSREQILTAHGIPPRLMSIILDAKGNAAGGQELEAELKLFHLSFVKPRQHLLETFLNPHLPAPIILRDFLPDVGGNGSTAPAEAAAEDDGGDGAANDDGGEEG